VAPFLYKWNKIKVQEEQMENTGITMLSLFEDIKSGRITKDEFEKKIINLTTNKSKKQGVYLPVLYLAKRLLG
jgi:hypothetical protein